MKPAFFGLVLGLPVLAGAAPAPVETLQHGRFESVRLERPAGAARSFALLLTGADGAGAQLAPALRREGALVAVVDGEAFLRRMERDGGDCQFANGDLENLSRYLQAYAQLPAYYPPVLLGQGSGAGLVYGVLAQSKAESFAAGLAIDFCPELAMRQPLCAGAGVQLRRAGDGWRYRPTPLRAPLAILQPATPGACSAAAAQRFVQRVPQASLVTLPDAAQPFRTAAAYRRLVERRVPPPPPRPADLDDLPIVEVPVQGDAGAFAILISGDGGWAGIDQDLAARLAARGVAVVGLDSLRYFWKSRTPDSTAQDLARLIRAYRARWPQRRVWLLGYSQGGDVLPFILNRLPPDVRKALTLAVPMALGRQAHFEFHLSNWLGTQGTHPIAPELQRLAGRPELLLICAQAETESVCKDLDPAQHRIAWFAGGHHFNGDYQGVANAILHAGLKQ